MKTTNCGFWAVVIATKFITQPLASQWILWHQLFPLSQTRLGMESSIFESGNCRMP